MTEERFCRFLILCGRHDGYREAKDILDVLIARLREDGVLADANGDVAHVVDRRNRQTAEVARTRERDVDEFVEEVEHSRATKRHLKPNRVSFAHLEGRNRKTRGARRRFLASDLCEAILDEFDDLFVALLADSRGNDYLFDTRRLHRTRKPERLAKRVICLLLSLFGDIHTFYLTGVLLFTATRVRTPSRFSMRTRLGFFVSGSMSMTFET